MKTFNGFCNAFPSFALGGLITAYRWVLSPLFASLGVQCRFVPSCSAYAAEAVKVHGAWKGSFLAVARVARCHPFCTGGHDPVPGPFSR